MGFLWVHFEVGEGLNYLPYLKLVRIMLKTLNFEIEPPGHDFNSHSKSALYNYSNLIVCSVSDFISDILFIVFVSRHFYFSRNFLEVIT